MPYERETRTTDIWKPEFLGSESEDREREVEDFIRDLLYH